MKSRKLAILGLTAALSLGLLTVCSGDNDDTNEAPAGSTSPVIESGAPVTDSLASWTSVADLEGAKIAAQEGITGNDMASAIPSTEVGTFKAVAQYGMELISGRVDCIIVDTHPAQSLVDANPDKLMVLDFPASEKMEAYATAAQKNDTGAVLAEESNTATATFQENGTFDALVDKYISKNEDAQLPELKIVENSKGALVMDANYEFEPLGYLGENGDPTGLDMGFAQYLCTEIGYTLAIRDTDFDALIPVPQSGRIDSITADLTRGEEQEKNANFIDGYYEAVQSIVVAKPAA